MGVFSINTVFFRIFFVSRRICDVSNPYFTDRQDTIEIRSNTFFAGVASVSANLIRTRYKGYIKYVIDTVQIRIEYNVSSNQLRY